MTDDFSAQPRLAHIRQGHEGWIRCLCWCAMLIGAYLVLQSLPLEPALAAWTSHLQGAGISATVVFGLTYIVATLLLIPGSVLTWAAGASFGPWQGTVIVSVASTTAAALAFLIARYFAREMVERKAGRYPRFAAIDRAIGEGGWRIVGLLRLSPAVPFNIQNYLYGLTRIRFWPYVLTSWIAMLPGTVLYVSIGHVSALAIHDPDQRSPAEWAMWGISLLATIAVTVYLARLARRAIRDEILDPSPPHPEGSLSEPPTTDRKKLSQSVVRHVVAAVVILIFGIWCYANQESLGSWIQQSSDLP